MFTWAQSIQWDQGCNPSHTYLGVSLIKFLYFQVRMARTELSLPSYQLLFILTGKSISLQVQWGNDTDLGLIILTERRHAQPSFVTRLEQ